MRNSFIKFLFFLMSSISLFASEYSWSVYTSKSEVYVNEAVYLKYVCTFSDRADLYSIEFNPITDNEVYSIKLLSEETKLIDGKKVNVYEYVVFIKKAIDIDLSFDALMKKTTKASIENTVLGRDNIDYEEFSKSVVKQESVKLRVKEIPVSIFGDFSLVVKEDENQKKAYEPYHLGITISGTGDFDSIKELDFSIEGVEVFSQKPLVQTTLTKEGYKGSWNQKFAFVGSGDFTIPAVKIKYFDGEEKSIDVQAMKVSVEQGYKKEELLDAVVESKPINIDFIYYILTFITGFLVAKIKFKRKYISSSEKVFIDKIKAIQTKNELSILLVLNNEKLYKDIILELDSENGLTLSQAKKEAIEINKR